MSLTPPLVAFLLSLVLTPVTIVFARRTRLVDVPDGMALKIHRHPIPNAGGLVLASSVLPAILLSLRGWEGLEWKICVLATGSLLSVMLGLADDLKDVKPLTRLFLQAALGAGVGLGGLRPDLFASGLLNSVLGMLIVVGAMNAFNLLDGMDGLATGVTAICAGAFAVLSYARGDAPVFVLASTIFAAFIGFLPYNFHPASIFLGNSGSYLTGFLLAALTIFALSDSPTPAGCIGSLLIVGLPAADTAFAVVRRLKARRGIMVGDRDHFYDKLLRRGFSQKQSALIGYTAAASFAASGLFIILNSR